MANKNISSYKLYIILSAIAIGTLMGVFITSFIRLSQYDNSVNESKEMFSEYVSLEKLADKYKWIEKEQLKASLLKQKINTDRWKEITKDIDAITLQLRDKFKKEAEQQERITAIAKQQEKLFKLFYGTDSTFSSLQSKVIRKQLNKTSVILHKIDSIKEDIITHHQIRLSKKIHEQEVKYHSFIKMMVISSIIALILLLISIYKLFVDKRQHNETSSFLENILNETNDIVTLYKPVYKKDKVVDFKIEYASSANSLITDIPVHKLVGKRATKAFPFLEPSGELSKLIQSFETQKKIEEITEVTIKDKVGTYLTRFFPSSRDVKIIVSDISKSTEDAKKVETLNHELEVNNRILNEAEKIANIGNYIWYLEEDMSVLSDNTYRILGYEPQSLQSSNQLFSEFVHPDDVEIYEKAVQESYENNKPLDVTFRIITKQNDIKYLYSKGNFLDVNGKKAIIGILQDVTKRINAERELQLSNDLLLEAEKIANMGSYVWFMTEDNTFLSDNVYRILGYEPQEFASSAEKFREFTHPEDIELYDRQINNAYENDQPIDFIFRVITKQNVIKHLYTTGVFNKHDGKTTMIGIIQDVSKRVETEQILKQKNAELMHQNVELESFNRIASHDLQEPLRKVQMYLSRLSDDDNLSKRSQQYIERANDASSRMRVLINNLLSFSRINRKNNEFTLVNLNSVLQSVKEDLSLKIEESNVQIIAEELPTVSGIEFQLNQLFNNLVSNAIKYRDTLKPLHIKITSKKLESTQIDEPFVKNHSAYHQIKITDNGIGFDNNMRDKIFEMFQRLHQKHEYSGTGIGLAICKKIVTKHNGYIQATSIKGSGSVFTFYLPA